MTMRFALAPMDPLIRVLTLICYAIPIGLAAAALRAPMPVGGVLLGVSGFMVVLYAIVWLWFRPRAFVVTPDTIDIEWPLRRRRIDRSAIVSVRVLDHDDLRENLGRIVRIGAGGLWGGFGLARTSQGLHELWISRVDRVVWIRCAGRRSLLITPEDPDRFIAEL
jgi:hypothetical protein